MSDLQCPARVHVVRGGSVDAATLVAALAGERVAHVWSSPEEATLALAREAAGLLGCGTSVHAGPWPVVPALPGDGRRLVGGLGGIFEEIEDRFRGEAVLVILPPAEL